MKRTMLLVVVIGILSTFSLFAFETVQYNVTNEKLQSDKVYDVFFMILLMIIFLAPATVPPIVLY